MKCFSPLLKRLSRLEPMPEELELMTIEKKTVYIIVIIYG